MFQQQISHNPDLKQLRDEGYEIEVKGGYLLIHHIPYVNNNREIRYGSLVSELSMSGNRTTKPTNHVIYFVGEHPCNKDGSIIVQIQHGSQNQQLDDGLTITHSFSNKPAQGYENYHHKVTRYADIISAPAKSIDASVTERTFRVVVENEEDSVFQYFDSNSSRANINIINAKFKGQKIAIVGLGGTGAYILDLVAKNNVQEIHLFDGDEFLQHNAFRSPGAASVQQLNEQMKKVDYYSTIYSRMHKNIFAHPNFIDSQNIDVLEQMTYVFICVDKNSVRKNIINYLLCKNIPFTDVGLGINIVENNLIGTVRVTSANSSKSDHLVNRISQNDDTENEYSTNIQIADLNSLNAVLAVIKWKKVSGFYQDLEQEHHSTYSINVSQLTNEDFTA
jgi:hypothetical protein